MKLTPDFQKTFLGNKLRLVTVPMPQSQSVTVIILAGTGSRFEDKKLNGISHFLEHMLFKGTKNRPNQYAISTAIDGIGGEFNAYTDKEHTAYYIKCLPNHLDLALDVLTDMVLNSQFKTAEIEKERGVILQEIAMYEDLPQYKVQNIFEALLYSKSPLGWDIAGTPQSVKNIYQGDFLSYVKSHYHPRNLVVVIAGNFHPPQAKQLVQKYLGKTDMRGKTHPKPHEKFPQTSPQAQVFSKTTEQTHLIMGFRGHPIGHPDRYTEAVLSAVLGGSMSSRLFRAVREERGLAYYIKSTPQHYLDTGYLAARAGVKVKSAKEAIKVILDEFYRLTQTPVAAKELSVAKEWVKGNLALDLEDSLEKAKFYGEQELLEGKIRTPAQMLSQVDQVTAANIKNLATKLFVSKTLNLAVVGPHPTSSFDTLINSFK